ncbi:MAG: J domain-containing protein [Fimbriimonadaceae bacterium]|nr:J domain-containing protein [Fimbriimonadaceae bacterium]
MPEDLWLMRNLKGKSDLAKHASGSRLIELDLTGIRTVFAPALVPTGDDGPSWAEVVDHPQTGKVIELSEKGDHEGALERVGSLTPAQLSIKWVARAVATSFRKVVVEHLRAGHLVQAAETHAEFLSILPEQVGVVDLRRHNRIISQLDKAGILHTYESVSVTPIFALVEAAEGYTIRERHLLSRDRGSRCHTIGFSKHGTWQSQETGVTHVSRNGVEAAPVPTRGHYRIGQCPCGDSIAILDDLGSLLVINATSDLLYEAPLDSDERVVRHFDTLDTTGLYWGTLRTQVRCVAVSPNSDRFLFTLADEAWSCSTSGETIKGVRMPPNAGWRRRSGGKSDGTALEIKEALQTLELELPTDVDRVKSQYWKLAKKRHPDIIGVEGTEAMQQLNAAFTLVTGIDASVLSSCDFTSSREFFERIGASGHETELAPGIFVTFESSGPPQEWIYSGCYSASESELVLGLYSGKVLFLTVDGLPRLLVEVGSCPVEIISTESCTYVETHERILAIAGEHVAVVHDREDGFVPFVTAHCLILKGDKWLKCIGAAGNLIWHVSALEPIESFKETENGWVIRTREHEAVVTVPR